MALLTFDARFAFRILAKFRRSLRTHPAQRAAKEFRTALAVLALMEGDGVDDAEMYFTPFRPVAQLTLPLRHLRLRSSQKSRGPLP